MASITPGSNPLNISLMPHDQKQPQITNMIFSPSSLRCKKRTCIPLPMVHKCCDLGRQLQVIPGWGCKCPQCLALPLEIDIQRAWHKFDPCMRHHQCRRSILPELAGDHVGKACLRLAKTVNFPLRLVGNAVSVSWLNAQLAGEACKESQRVSSK